VGGGGGSGEGERQRRQRRLSPPALRAEEFAARAAGLPQEPRVRRGAAQERRPRSSETSGSGGGGGGGGSESSASRRRPGEARSARSPPRLPAAAGGASPRPSPRPARRGRPGQLRGKGRGAGGRRVLGWEYDVRVGRRTPSPARPRGGRAGPGGALRRETAQRWGLEAHGEVSAPGHALSGCLGHRVPPTTATILRVGSRRV
jgi:hypothetical protein